MPRISLRSGIALTAALLATAAVVGGVVVFASARSGGAEITTAALVPADALVYGVVNTDLTSSQWVNAFKLAERLGQKQPQQQLKDTAGSTGDVSWDTDIVPFLGGDAAVYLRSTQQSGGLPSLALIARCKDAGKAMATLLKKSGESFKKGSHAGVSYQYSSDRSQFVARLGSYLVAATDEQSMFAVLDVHGGKQKALAGGNDYKALRGKLGSDFLGFFYIDGRALADAALGDAADLQGTLNDLGADFALKPYGVVVTAKNNSLQVEALSTGKVDAISPLLQTHQSHFAKVVSADTSLFFSTTGLTRTYNDAVKRNRSQIDDAITKQGDFSGLDDALQQVGQSLGLTSLRDAIGLFAGETAVAVQFPGSSLDSPQVLLLAEVQDEKQARDVMNKISTAAADSRPKTEKVNGIDMVSFVSSDTRLAYTVTGGYAAVGSSDSVRKLLQKKGSVLADLPGYKNTASELTGGLGTFAYLDLGTLLSKGIGGSGDIGQAEHAVEGMIVNLVSDHDVLRLTGAVSAAR